MISSAMRAYRNGGMDEVLWRVRRKAGFVRRLQSRYRFGGSINSVYGVKLACNFEDVTFRMYVNGSYGRFYWNHLKRISEPFVFVDIGANQGLYTLCAASNESNIKSYAFEPNSKTHEFLKKNIALNKFEAKCEALKLAISNSSGHAELRMSENHSGGASLAKANDDFGDTSIDIQTIDHSEFDNIMDDSEVPIVVKVDVEGFEQTVLSELMKSKNADRITEVFYEVDEGWVDADGLRDLLVLAGFKNFEIIGSGAHYDVLASR